LYFLRRGFTKACLNTVGKLASEKERLMILVIGLIRDGRQDLSKHVGIMSRVHVESVEDRIAVCISSGVASLKCSNGGGEEVGRK
jgi:hypothetical protein